MKSPLTKNILTGLLALLVLPIAVSCGSQSANTKAELPMSEEDRAAAYSPGVGAQIRRQNQLFEQKRIIEHGGASVDAPVEQTKVETVIKTPAAQPTVVVTPQPKVEVVITETEKPKDTNIPEQKPTEKEPKLTPAPQPAPQPSPLAKPATPAIAQKSISIKVSIPKQEMQVFVDDTLKYTWEVATGKDLTPTPTGSWIPFLMDAEYYSKAFKVILPWGIKFFEGYLIHASKGPMGEPRSNGCVRLTPEHAQTLFYLVKDVGLTNTLITVE